MPESTHIIECKDRIHELEEYFYGCSKASIAPNNNILKNKFFPLIKELVNLHDSLYLEEDKLYAQKLITLARNINSSLESNGEQGVDPALFAPLGIKANSQQFTTANVIEALCRKTNEFINKLRQIEDKSPKSRGDGTRGDGTIDAGSPKRAVSWEDENKGSKSIGDRLSSFLKPKR